MELWYLTSVHCLMMLNICTMLKEIISKDFSVIERMQFVYIVLTFTKRYKSVKNVGEIMVYCICSVCIV